MQISVFLAALSTAGVLLANDGGLVFDRRVSVGDDGCETTVVTVTNPTERPLRIGSVTVWEKTGAEAAPYVRGFLDRDDSHDGMPSAVRLLEPDETFLTFASDFYWTSEERTKAFAKMPTTLWFNDFGWFDRGADADEKLVIGFTGLWTHYCDLYVSTDAARTQVTQIVAKATFDCVLPPGKSRTTAPFVVFKAKTAGEAETRYTALVAAQAKREAVSTRNFDAPPPSVGCTWHYWGGAIDETKVMTDLAEVKRRGIPLDYFLIDDFWQYPYYGDWECNREKFPQGMRHLADCIRAAGMRPGVWSSPFSCNPTSRVARAHADMFLRDRRGENVKWFGDWVVDVTHPEGLKFVRELYTRLAKEYGFEYFKLDRVNLCGRTFRADGPVCHDPTVTVVEAYRRTIAEVRAAVGERAFICICGGLFGASLGLCDTQRLSGDTYGSWYAGADRADPTLMLEEGRLKQIFGRLRWRPLYYSNPDGLEIRKREKPLDLPRNWGLSRGHLTDDEAMATAVAAYVAGGIVMFGDSAADLTEDRLAIYRRVMPALGAQSRAVDPFRPWIPSQYVTTVTPRCAVLGRWNTASVFNFEKQPQWPSVALAGEVVRGLGAREYHAYETVTGAYLGRFPVGARISLGKVPSHAARVVKVIPVPELPAPVLLGTDLHVSGGGVEIATWTPRADGTADFAVRTPWPNRAVKVIYLPAGATHPVTVTAR